MDYPWWTIEAANWGFREEGEIHCLDCAEANQRALVREMTDTEIEDAGGVACGTCGKRWPAIAITGALRDSTFTK